MSQAPISEPLLFGGMKCQSPVSSSSVHIEISDYSLQLYIHVKLYTKCSIFLQYHPAYGVQVWGMASVDTSVPATDVQLDKIGPARACSSHHSPSTTSYSLSHQPSYSRNVIILALYVAVIHSNSPQPLSIQGQDTSPPARLDQDYPAWGR